MPLQSSGIIVVDKTSVISAQSSGHQQQPKGALLTNNLKQDHLPILSGVISDNIGALSQYKKQQQQQQKIMYGISTINNTTSFVGDDNRLTDSTTPVKNTLRRHQRIISTSSATLSSQQQQQLKQQQQQQQQQQNFSQQITQINPQHVIQSNQVIVSKEYIEHAHAVGAHVVNISANDLLNPQIYKLVSSDGNGQNVLIDSLGNVTTSNGSINHHPANKLVVSNLTVLSSKQQQQQLNASAGQAQQQQQINFVNAKQIPYIAKNQTVQKIVNVPLKQNNILKNQQQQHLAGNIIQTTTGTTNSPGQIIQKVTMPRNVQVVARVQTVGQNKQAHHQSQQQQQNTNQLIMQQKYIHNVSGNSTNGNSNTNVIQTKLSNVNAMKKQNLNQMKIQQHKLTNSSGNQPQQQQQQQVKTFIHQQQSQQHFATGINQNQQIVNAKPAKSQKIVKQFNNNLNTTSSAITLMQQQQQITQSGTYTINNKVNNVQIQSQQQQTKVLSSSKNNPSTKYLMQNQIVIPTNSTSTTINQNIQNSHKSNQNLSKNQQIVNSQNSSSGGVSSGTIKFVNAHGSIVQGQQQKARQNNMQQQQFVDTNKPNSDNNLYHIQTTTTFLPTHQQQQTTTNDDIAARILQSMKSFGNQRQYQQQQKLLHKPTSPLIQNDNVVQHNLLAGREYPIYTSQQQQQQQQYPIYQPAIPAKQINQTNSSRSQTLDRKHHDNKKPVTSTSQIQNVTTTSLSSSEFFRVNTNEIHKNYYSSPSTCNTTIIDNIPLPLPLPRGDNTIAAQQAEHEDDIIGEEVRPLPVTTHDIRLQALHAFLQDHTYVAPMPTRLPNEMIMVPTTPIMLIGQQQDPTKVIQQQQSQPTTNQTPTKLNLSDNGLITSGGQVIVGSNRTSTGSVGMNYSGGILPNNTSGSEQLGKNTSSDGYSFGQNLSQHNSSHQIDDDANSVISNDSRNGHGRLEMDLGEETETAPEAEAEDDSVTRCICDLAHDDGYMICCDKCSVWQHVDCMGIDRQNIPDEYLCELCQPRDVDKTRARNIQLAKRKEQALFMNAQLNVQAAGAETNNVLLRTDINGQLISSTQMPDGKISLAVIPPMSGKKGKMRKNDISNKKASTKKERNVIKRKETKRVTKRKSKNMNNAESKQADKHAENLRQWIENYEIAVTNHYSPELRARLHAITKHPNLLQSITSHENKWLKNCQNMESKGTTVPHAGGKILISNFDILPNSAIVELRGKYMLTTQYRTQNPSINMNTPTITMQSIKNQKISGPFIFFYQLPVDSSAVGGLGGLSTEICVDTRTYGNEARFVRRSCRPNAELQYSFEKGTIHLYIVSLVNIMASTEITIKHEPHDLLALENKSLNNGDVSPTSTVCACGLTKECLFGSTQMLPVTQSQFQETTEITKSTAPAVLSSTTKNTKGTRKNFLNGYLSEKRAKKNSNINRGRSTSSSGDSNTGLLSPNINSHFKPNLYNSASITSVMHDSGVYTSSSSPSVSIPSPSNINISTNSPPQLHLPQNLQILQQNNMPVQSIGTSTVTATVVQSTTLQQPVPQLQTQSTIQMSPQQSIEQQSPQPIVQAFSPKRPDQESESTLVLTSNATVVLAPAETLPQSIPPTTIQTQVSPPPVNQEAPKSVPATPEKQTVIQMGSATKKTPIKSRTTSSSEDITATPTSESKSENKRDSRKLTREERKMEAIVRAFEKMEKNQQRKNELKHSKSVGGKRRNSTSPSPKRIKSLSQLENADDSIPSLTSNSFQKQNNFHKKKRKNSKSYPIQMAVAQRKRRSRMNSANSDAMMTSEDSTSLLSPPLPDPNEKLNLTRSQSINKADLNKSECVADSNINQAAGLLLAFANPQEKHERLEPYNNQQQNDQNVDPTQPLVSPACLLIEKVLGLESFKLPPKTTKTKKTLMSDWLNQSNEDEELENHSTSLENTSMESTDPMKYQSSRKGLETLVQAALVDFRQSSPNSTFLDNQKMTTKQPQHFNFVAKKVEAFINQNQCNNYMTSNPTSPQEFNLDSPSASDSVKFQVPSSVDHHQNSYQPLQLSSCSNSAAKKRWLRQAISEETDETAQPIATHSPANAQTSASNSPTSQCPAALPNGFTTPLKKRRVVVMRNEENLSNVNSPEDLNLIKSSSDSSLSNEEIKIEENEIKSESKEQTEYEDDVDILRSPSPSEKIVAEDLNLVKIEREDITSEIKVDVEKEEPCDILKKVENKIDESETQDNKSEQKVVEDIKTDADETKVLEKVEEVKVECKADIELKIIEEDCKAIETSEIKEEEISKEIKNQDEPVTLQVETDNFESVSDEIADIQKKLHSFHTENIMILQSRNKKSKRSLKSSDTEIATGQQQLQKNKVCDKKTNEKKLRKKRKQMLDADKTRSSSSNTHHQTENSSKHKSSLKNDDKKRRESSTSSSSRNEERKHSIEDSMIFEENNLKKLNNQPVPVHITSNQLPPNGQKQILPMQQQNILSSYIPVNNFEIQNSLQQQQYSNQLIQTNSQSIQNQYSSQPPPSHLPYYNTIYGKLLDNIKVTLPNSNVNNSNSITSTQTNVGSTGTKSTILLSDYLDTKVKSYNTLGGYVSHSSLFGLNDATGNSGQQAANPTDAANSETTSVLPNTAGKSNGPTAPTPPPKILTKTASHDPRLNPILTAPEPAPTPKRKLSINEYRKRKQQSTESSGNSQEGEVNASSGSSPNDKVFDNGNDKIDRIKEDINDSSKVQFSPAPTLLEQQQEILCERLKSMKQKSTTFGAPTNFSLEISNNNNFSSHDKTNEIDGFNTSLTTKSFLHNSSNSLDSISSSSSSSSADSPSHTENMIDNINDNLTKSPSYRDNELLINAINVNDIDSSKINFNELRKISKNISEMNAVHSQLSASTTTTNCSTLSTTSTTTNASKDSTIES